MAVTNGDFETGDFAGWANGSNSGSQTTNAVNTEIGTQNIGDSV